MSKQTSHARRYAESKAVYEKALNHIPLENCKLRQDTTTHLTVWLQFKTLTASNACEDAGQKELVGMQNTKATFKDSLVVSSKAKHSLSIRSSNGAPRY